MRGGNEGRTNQGLALYWNGDGWTAAVRHKPERQRFGEVRVDAPTVLEVLRKVSARLTALGGGPE